MKKEKEINVFVRGLDRAAWAKYKYLADVAGETATDRLKRHVEETAVAWDPPPTPGKGKGKK